MGLLKTALIGAAVYGAVKYITKKDILTGKSIVDEVQERMPAWKERAREFSNEISAKLNTQPTSIDLEGYWY